MAKIIRKEHQIEKEYFAKKKKKEEKREQATGVFWGIFLIAAVVYITCMAVTILLDMLSTLAIPLTVCLVVVLLTALLIYAGNDAVEYTNTASLIAGINGERIATRLLMTLPDDYTVFQGVMVTYDGKTSEIDNIIVGRSGVFIVEVKNHNGTIVGDGKETYWNQHKIGRGGTPYMKEIYSPVKQVGTHIYRLANYLRQNGIHTYVEGMVYFTNLTCMADIVNDSTIPVYSASSGGEEQLCRKIMSGEHRLDAGEIRRICELIDRL